MNVIAFTGKRGMGKTTAASFLEEEFQFAHINFADTLREVTNLVYGVSFEEMGHPVKKEQVLTRHPYRSPRDLLQNIGTELFRNFIPDTWIEAWKRKVREALEPSEAAAINGSSFGPAAGVTCSDCRFLNEAETVHAAGGIIIKIVDPRKQRDDAASQHQSETEIDLLPVDHVIINDGSINDLRQQVLALVRQLRAAA